MKAWPSGLLPNPSWGRSSRLTRPQVWRRARARKHSSSIIKREASERPLRMQNGRKEDEDAQVGCWGSPRTRLMPQQEKAPLNPAARRARPASRGAPCMSGGLSPVPGAGGGDPKALQQRRGCRPALCTAGRGMTPAALSGHRGGAQGRPALQVLQADQTTLELGRGLAPWG